MSGIGATETPKNSESGAGSRSLRRFERATRRPTIADMYEKAIAEAAGYTRALHFIARREGSRKVLPGAATLFFVNAEGWALTAGHVADQLLAAEALGAARRRRKPRRGEIVEMQARFVGCVEGSPEVEIRRLSTDDLALVKFTNFRRLDVSRFPRFAKKGSALQPGRLLCRLGYPFPEFTNFRYDTRRKRIAWTEEGHRESPRFPMDGMVTRLVGDAEGRVRGFETATIGLRGQSGGPAFDADGLVWGMQSSTGHLPLGFESADGDFARRALHVARCVHVDVIKEALEENGVAYDAG